MAELNDGGLPPTYDGEDYGLYQIYGQHILCGPDALLYVGKTTEQTFSRRLGQHQSDWLAYEDSARVYVGRVYVRKRHTARDNWATWAADVLLAERVLIYMYSPHYNSSSIAGPLDLAGHDKVELLHMGQKHRLGSRDVAPDDWS